MYLIDDIKMKFINEAADLMIDSLDDYSEYINENRDFQYFTELIPYHLIGYNATEKFLTCEGRYSAFRICSDYVQDFRDIFGEPPAHINSEYIFQFYLDTYVNNLVSEIEQGELFDEDGNVNHKQAVELIEYWRALELKWLNDNF